MAEAPRDLPSLTMARQVFYVLGSTGLVVAALYLGQRIFVPLALAILLTLLLSPVVSRLERRGLGRLPAVLSAACLAFLLIGLAGWAVAAQVAGLVGDLPAHKANIRDKIAWLQGSGKSGVLGQVQDFLDEVDKGGGQVDAAQPAAGPVVRVQPEKPPLTTQLQGVIGRFLGAVTILLAVTFLVVALLLNREDVRNRVIRLAGRGRLTVTTRALDEAGKRIGGYLLGHSAVNTAFGAAIGLGMALLSVPYPALWALLAGAFRFLPSIGVWLIAPLPAMLAFVSSPGYLQPVWVLGLFLALDLLTSNLFEPWVCGRSVGLAPVPLLLAVMFWTGLWGLIGLVLATPMTVCLAVLGKYVPQLRFLGVMLSREEALRPAARYYQRLLARDRYEAGEVVREYLAEHPTEELFDHVLLPALALVRKGQKAGELRSEDVEFILRTTLEIVKALSVATPSVAMDPDLAGAVILGVPATDAVDDAALHMLLHLAKAAGSDLVVADGPFAPGVTALVHETAPAAVFVAAVGPGGLTEARFLCRRLRAQLPGVKIVVGRWGRGKDQTKARTLLLSAGADRVVNTLREARAELLRMGHTLLQAERPDQQPV